MNEGEWKDIKGDRKRERKSEKKERKILKDKEMEKR